MWKQAEDYSPTDFTIINVVQRGLPSEEGCSLIRDIHATINFYLINFIKHLKNIVVTNLLRTVMSQFDMQYGNYPHALLIQIHLQVELPPHGLHG